MKWLEMPPLASLRAYAAYVEAGGVQEAGAALNVSHAAISQQLRALEAHLGVSLLNRDGRAMQLTEDGKALAEAVKEGFSRIETVVAALTGAEAARPLHVSTTTSFAAAWLMPRLAGFRADHPEVDLMVAPNPERVDPSPGGVDLAIRYGSGGWPGVEAELLMTSPVVGVAAPSLVGDNPPSDPAELAQFPWLEDLGAYEGSRWLETKGQKLKGGLVTAPGNLMVDAARAGQGIAIVAQVAVQADLEAGRLVQLFEDDLGTGYWLVTRAGVQRPALRQFIAWLRREAAI